MLAYFTATGTYGSFDSVLPKVHRNTVQTLTYVAVLTYMTLKAAKVVPLIAMFVMIFMIMTQL